MTSKYTSDVLLCSDFKYTLAQTASFSFSSCNLGISCESGIESRGKGLTGERSYE